MSCIDLVEHPGQRVTGLDLPADVDRPARRAGPAGLRRDAEPQVGVALEAHGPAEPGDRGRRGAATLGQLDDGGPGRCLRVTEHVLGDPAQRPRQLPRTSPDPGQYAIGGDGHRTPPVDRVGVDHRGPRGGVHLVINHGTPFRKEC
ncbi:hypothetical protein GCM10027452_31090 [Micromonospora halotolerans]